MSAVAKELHPGESEDYVTWTEIGGLEVGLRTRRIEHIEDDSREESEMPTIDLAAVLGRAASANDDSARLVFINATPPYALRIRGKVMLTGPTPDLLLSLPPFVNHLRLRPGIEAISERTLGFGYVLDLDRVGLRLLDSLRPPALDAKNTKDSK